MTQNTNSNDASEKGSLSPFVCACFTFNYLLGTGFLTLPWAFQRAGLLLSTFIMVLCCVVANVSSDYILSAMARAEAITADKTQEESGPDNNVANDPSYEVSQNNFDDGVEETPLLGNDSSTTQRKYVTTFSMECSTPQNNTERKRQQRQQENEQPLMIQTNKFDFTELCHIFLGTTGQKIYSAYVCLDIYSFLWVYASVFANAMAKIFQTNQDQDLYPWFVLIFAIIVVPMSLLELSEQAYLQVFLSGCRILMVFLIVLTPMIAATASSYTPSINDGLHSIPHFGNQIQPNGIMALSNVSHIHQMIPIVVYSVIFHQAVPGLAHEAKQKSKIGTIFAYTFFLCGLTYTMIGWIDAWYFGDAIYESCNLNWQVYHGGTGRFVQFSENDQVGRAGIEGEWVDVAIWARFVSFFVVIFPAVDVVSAFPIYAFILGNSMRDMVKMTRKTKRTKSDTNTGNINTIGDEYGMTSCDGKDHKSNRHITIFYRAMAAIPPILGAFFVRDLGIVTDYSGLTGLAIAFCFPPLLFIASDRKMRRFKLQKQERYQRTVYERFGSSIISAKLMFLFGLISIVYCFFLLIFAT